MSHWNNSTPDQRIQRWMQFRADIAGLELQEQAARTSEYFRDFPLGARSVDYYDPDSWPTPWEILHHKTYCRNSAGILMHDTLVIINKRATVKLVLIDDGDDVYLAPIINNSHILNVVLGEIIKMDALQDVKILERFHDEIDRQF